MKEIPGKSQQIDDVNFVEKEMKFRDGTSVRMGGISVRALIKTLQEFSPDDLVIYQEEDVQDGKEGIVTHFLAGAAGGSEDGIVCLLGPGLGRKIAEARGLIKE